MTTKLTAEKRDIFGKKLQAAREAGKLPISIYGAKEEAGSYFVEIKDFKKVLKEAGESTIVSLVTSDGNKETLIHEIAWHPLTGEPVHADFLAVETNKPITVHVPLEFIGESPAVKTLSAMIVKVLHELEIEALPKDLPHQIEVDLSSLVDLESRITVADIKLPTGVTTELDPEEIVVSVTEAGEEVVEEEAPVDLSAIEVEKKGKEEEGGEGEETAKSE
jgi:large subunit ribosomal protein L25